MPKNTAKNANGIPGYTILPLCLPATPHSKQATHYLYLRPHEPRIPDPDAARSLFLVNIPIDTTELHLRHLFGSQLAAGRVERVVFNHFNNSSTTSTTAADVPLTTMTTTDTGHSQGTKKRKRQEPTAAELEVQLRQVSLPSVWGGQSLHASGSHAVVVFVDRPAMEASLKAAVRKASSSSSSSSSSSKAGKEKGPIVWAAGIEDRVAAAAGGTGSARYRQHCSTFRFPPASELLGIVNNYMSLFTEVEEARAREAARRAQEPDEDGFVKVTRGPRFTDVAREDEVKELVEKQKKREEGLGDFYRFQTREKRKDRQNELLRRFEEDKRKIERLKRDRGKILPEKV